jgi:hypothetical protein
MPASAAADGAAQRGGPAEHGEQKKPLKEMSKAERRALQEAQRAAKAAAKGGPAASGSSGGGAAPAADSKPLQKQGSGTNLARQGGPVSRQSSFAKQEAEGKGGPAAAAGGEQQQQGKGGRKAGAAVEVAAATVPAAAKAKSAEMFAHLPQPRHVTLQSVAEQKGPPGGLACVPGVGAWPPQAVWCMAGAACSCLQFARTLPHSGLLLPFLLPDASMLLPPATPTISRHMTQCRWRR